jgi:hypothetical protein
VRPINPQLGQLVNRAVVDEESQLPQCPRRRTWRDSAIEIVAGPELAGGDSVGDTRHRLGVVEPTLMNKPILSG